MSLGPDCQSCQHSVDIHDYVIGRPEYPQICMAYDCGKRWLEKMMVMGYPRFKRRKKVT